MTLVSVLVFTAVLIYIIFSAAGKGETLQTVEAVGVEMRDSVPTVGYLVRRETPVFAYGDVAVTAEDGAKLAMGETVAVRYRSSQAMERAARMQDLQQRIESLTELKNGKTREELASESLLALSACVASGKLGELYPLALNVEAAILSPAPLSEEDEAAELRSLTAELEALSLAAEGDMDRIRAETPGLFSLFTDGYEHVSPDDLYDIRPSGVKTLLRTTGQTENAVGKLITDIRWYYVTVVTEADAAKLQAGKHASVEFSRNYNAALSMTVESVSPAENGECAVVLSCPSFMQDVAALREMTAELVFGRKSGIRVPREAVHVDEEGKTFVYILEGLRAKKVVISILREDSEGYMVEKTEGGLRVRDQIILQAENLRDGAVVAE